jgi:hypothetical protein
MKELDIKWFSRKPKSVKRIITLLGICFIGLIVLITIGSILPDSMIPGNFSESKLYENEYLSFKYPQSLVDITLFENYDKDKYIFFSIFEDREPERNCMVVNSEKLYELSVPTYLDQYYESINNSKRDHVRNFTLEKIDFNGIPSVKLTEEYYEEINTGKYAIFLFFVHDGNFYTLYFNSDKFISVEYMYELAKSSLKLK